MMSYDTISVNCQWSAWSEWSSCSKSCGTGQKQKSRSIMTNAKNGGQPCMGSNMQTEVCTIRPCKFLLFSSRWFIVFQASDYNTILLAM